MSDLPSRSQASQALDAVTSWGYDYQDNYGFVLGIKGPMQITELLEIVRAFVDGRLIDRDTINYQAAAQRAQLYACSNEEAELIANSIIAAALGEDT